MRLLVILPALALTAAACAQPAEPPRPAPYPCDGCEVVRAYPAGALDGHATLAGPEEPGERLVLSGRVLQADGQTPAANVVLYLHQTDATGRYRREGGALALQGWLQTGPDGRYQIDTIRPAPYPHGGMPAHIHVYVGEPGREPYYVNDVVFEGDPEVTPAYLSGLVPGDDGVVRLVATGDGGWRGTRDIVLVP